MTGLDQETIAAVRDSLRAVFTGGPDADAIDRALRDLGWNQVLAEDPATATTLLFTEQGRALAASRLLADLMIAELSELLPPSAAEFAIVLPPLGSGSTPPPAPAASGLLLGPAAAGTNVVVPVTKDGEIYLAVVGSERLSTVPTTGFDAALPWCQVAVDVTDDELVPAGAAWTAAVAAGHRAVAAEIIGICSSALELAVTHTTDRHQYGRPLGSFQAVRHKLSEAHAAIEAATVTLAAAWAGHTPGSDPTEDAWAATVAKLRAGDTQAVVLRRTVQVMGAMGITLESDMHRYVTRAAALDLLLGGHLRLTHEIGAALLAGSPLHPVTTS